MVTAVKRNAARANIKRCVASAIVRHMKRILLLTLSALSCAALAHSTIVLGTLQSDPVSPAAGEPFTLTMTLHDPTDFPIEDAYVLAEFRQQPSDTPVEARFSELGEGSYQTEVSLPAGSYTLLLRDQTFRQEEARAELTVDLNGAALFPEERNNFLFPPTATSSSTLQTWLIWLIALPVAAGVLVTILVLRSAKEEDSAAV